MPYKVIQKLPEASEIIKQYPLSEADYASIKQNRLEIENILSGKDDRLIVIVGPCSAWPEAPVLEYADRLKKVSDKVSDTLKIVMRTYIQKPRTIKGWTGPLNQPQPLGVPNIEDGIHYCRDLMVKVVKKGLPIADECLFTHNSQVFQELLSWVAIGARSSEDQEHRIFASSLDCPVGMKNPTHGSLKVAVNSVVAAQHSHMATFDGYAVQTDGNPYIHLVLRGGNGKINYDVDSLLEAKKNFDASEAVNPAIIVDVSHDNCVIDGKKDHNAQANIAFEVMQNIADKPELRNLVKGFMVESFIKEGNQNHEKVAVLDMNGLSITDPCLGWERTEELIYKLAELNRKK